MWRFGSCLVTHQVSCARATSPDAHDAAFVRAALTHVGINAAVFLAALAWSLWLDRFALLTDPAGAVFGAGYTDVHVTRWALWAGVALSALAIAGVFFIARRGTERGMIATLAGYGIALFLITQIVPGDKVELELSPYDLTKARITFREQ